MRPQLFIDTATDHGLLALRLADGRVEERVIHAGNQSSRELLPAIRDLLQEHELVVSDLEQVLCGMGPGSFTGIRVALTVASSLAFGAGIPWSGYSSLMLWLPPTPGPYLSVLDARSGGLYAMAADWDGSSGRLLMTPRRLSIEEFVATSQTLGIERVVTPDQERVQQRLPTGWSVLTAPPSTLWIWAASPALQQTTIHYG
ncbi:MAG: tRNA (adenosine(37)-N6)-threonylcarbamoyltransferase complex dimerization subunit type 1 TsaB [Chlamydiia bacterium]